MNIIHVSQIQYTKRVLNRFTFYKQQCTIHIQHTRTGVYMLSVEGLYCQRPIRNIDPPPPHRLWCGGRTHSLGEEGARGQ